MLLHLGSSILVLAAYRLEEVYCVDEFSHYIFRILLRKGDVEESAFSVMAFSLCNI